jgi:multidrug efflux pump subunit AcrB
VRHILADGKLSPDVLDDLNRLPIKSQDGGTVYMRDVAHVHDGFAPQTNLVRVNGRHSVLVPVYLPSLAAIAPGKN